MLDIILIIVIIISLALLIWQVVKKFPRLVNINVNSLPDIKIKRQKDEILKGRLQRSWLDFFGKLKGLAGPSQEKFNNVFKQYYLRLKNIEKDLKRRGHAKLSSSVDKSQAVEDMITEVKQYINNEEYQKAEDVLLDALSIDQHNIEAYKILAEVYRYRKEYDQAKETLEYLLKLTHDDDAAVYSSLADLAHQRGNLKQAEDDYQKSISISDDNYLHFLSLAEVYLDLDEQTKALETAQRAQVLAPNNPKVLDFLINISIIMQDKELALQYINKLKEVNPENNKISEFIEQVDSL
jgi:tetratricopeptide (TPR) repeat protein